MRASNDHTCSNIEKQDGIKPAGQKAQYPSPNIVSSARSNVSFNSPYANNESINMAQQPPQQQPMPVQRNHPHIPIASTGLDGGRTSHHSAPKWTHIFDAILAQTSQASEGPVTKRFRKEDGSHDLGSYNQDRSASMSEYPRHTDPRARTFSPPQPAESTSYAHVHIPHPSSGSLHSEKMDSNQMHDKPMKSSKPDYIDRGAQLETENEAPLSRSERKRRREMKRRSDVNQGFDDLTSLLVKMDPPEFRVEGLDGDEGGAMSFNRVDLITKTVNVMSRLWKENREMHRSLEAEKRKDKDKMVMLFPIMVPADQPTQIGEPIPSGSIPLPPVIPPSLLNGNPRPTIFQAPPNHGGIGGRRNSPFGHGQSSLQWAQYASSRKNLELVAALRDSGMTHEDLKGALQMASIPAGASAVKKRTCDERM